MANVKINQGTQSPIAVDLVGTTNYQIIKLDQGAAGVSSLFTGTIPQVTSVGSVVGIGGTVNVDIVGTEPIIVEVGTIVAGTINTGTVNTGTINAGTIDLVKAGTLTALANGTIGAGTLNTLGTLSNLLAGSVAVIAGTGVITSGSVAVTAGTVTSGSIVVTAGTIGQIPNIPGGTLGVLSSLTTGSIVVTTGTIASIPNVPGGTINALANGTIGAGTINTLGTVANVNNGSIVVTNGTISTDTSINAIVSGTTSSTATLAAGGTWTGGTIDLLPYNTVRLSAFSDQDSAANGLKLRFSNDGTNWDITRQTTLTGNLGVYAAFNRVARYYSPQYINGAGSQTAFRLQTVLTPNSPEFTRRFLSEVPVSSNAGIITQANIFGTSTAGGGAFIQVKVAPSGAMQVGGAVDISTGTITTIAAGTQNTLGTVGVVSSLTNGSIKVTAGTEIITSGSIAVIAGTGVVTGGSIVVTAGTIGSIPNIPGGTLGVVSSLSAGTITKLEGGTLGVLSSLTNGSIVVTAGTIGSIPNIPGGTLGVVSSLTNGTVATNLLPLGGVVLTTPTAIGSAGTAFPLPATALSGRKSLICYNNGTATVYIGGGTVSTAAGIPIGTGQYSPPLDIGTTILYGIVPANAVGGTLIVMEVS